jgi:hypothetical protein
MTDERAVQDRLRLLPTIRRARLWRLYAEDGRRYLDLWMDGGASILGAKGTNIGTAAKAALDMGLTRPMPSALEARLEKALLAAYAGYKAARFFLDAGRALAAARALAPGESIAEPRPFDRYLMITPTASRVACPRLPCPSALAPGVLLFAEEGLARAAGGDLVPPLRLACAHRALVELRSFEKTYGESLWRRVDRRLAPHFGRSGPYLYPRLGAASDYDALFRSALKGGALLSPDPGEPSIVPGDFDDGEIAALAKALSDRG